MRIIKEGVTPKQLKRRTCDYCGTIFEIEKHELIATSQLGIIYDGLPSYHIDCPLCKKTIYFNWS